MSQLSWFLWLHINQVDQNDDDEDEEIFNDLVSAAVSLYWATSGVVGVMINMMLLHPPVRRAVRIPKISAELDKPYDHLRDRFLARKFL